MLRYFYRILFHVTSLPIYLVPMVHLQWVVVAFPGHTLFLKLGRLLLVLFFSKTPKTDFLVRRSICTYGTYSIILEYHLYLWYILLYAPEYHLNLWYLLVFAPGYHLYLWYILDYALRYHWYLWYILDYASGYHLYLRYILDYASRYQLYLWHLLVCSFRYYLYP